MAKRKTRSRSGTKKKGTSRSKKKGPGALRRLRENTDWERVRRVALAGFAIAGLGALVGGSMWAVPRLEAHASENGWTAEIEVRFLGAPAWVRDDLRLALERTLLGEMSGDPLRRLDLVAARQALLETGCFEEIRQVRRIDNDVVEVDATFVLPYAIISDDSGDYLVDERGRLLPSALRPGAHHPFVTITNPFFARPATAGESWPGSDVYAALQLIELFDRKPWLTQVRHIDVGLFQSARTLRLVTDRDGLVIWGSAPGDEGAREVPASQKVAVLDLNFRDYQHIDRGCDELNITGDVVTCRE